jgi:hypothetical protein
VWRRDPVNDTEWTAFEELLDQGFQGFDPARMNTYRTLLGDVPFDTVSAALRLLVADGKWACPMPGEVMDAARRVSGVSEVDAPPFEEAWRGITLLLLPASRGDTSLQRAVKAVAENVGEGAARWVAARGTGLMMELTEHPDHGGAVRHRLAQEYDRYCQQAAEDGKRGLALESAERAQLGAAGPRQIGEVLPVVAARRIPRGAAVTDDDVREIGPGS